MSLFGMICMVLLVLSFFRALRILLLGPYETARHPEKSSADAVSAWKKRTYPSPKEAEWALDSALEWAADFSAPTKKEAYKALDARLDHFLK